MDLVNNATGALEPVPDEEVADKFRSGSHGLPTGVPVPLRLRDGRLGVVNPEDVGPALDDGAEIVPQAQYDKEHAEDHYGGALNGALAAAHGAASSLSLNTLDPAVVGALKATGNEDAAQRYKEGVRGLELAHPVAHGAGSLLGLAGSVVAAPEAEAAVGVKSIARAFLSHTPAAYLERGATGIGSALEQGAAGILGTKGAGAALAHVAGTALKYGVEGGAWQGALGAGDQLTEDAFGDHDVTAQKVLAAGLHNAWAGAEIGGALGAGGAVLGMAGRGIAQVFSKPLEKGAAEAAVREMGMKTRELKQAARTAGGVEGVGKTLLKDFITPIAEKDGAKALMMTPAEKMERLSAVLDEKKSAIGAIADANSDVTERVGDMVKVLDRKIAAATGEIGNEGTVAVLSKWRESVLKVMGGLPPELVGDTAAEAAAMEREVSIGEAMKQRRALGRMIDQQSLDPSQPTKLLRSVAHEWGDLEEAKLDEVSRALGRDSLAGQELKRLNLETHQLLLVKKSLETQVAQHTALRRFGLNDYLAGGFIGELAGSALGGHGVIGGIAGVASGIAHKFVREHGNAYAAVGLNKLSKMEFLSKAVREADSRIGAAAKATAATSRRAGAASRAKEGAASAFGNDNDTVEERFKKARAAAKPPPQEIPGLADAAPQVHQSILNRMTQAAAYLNANAPRATNRPSLADMTQTPRYAVQDMERHSNIAEAVTDPIGVLHRAADTGRITPDEVEAIKENSPAVFEQFQHEVLTELANPRETDLPYDRVVLLSKLFGVAGDPSIDPQSVGLFQGNYTQGGPSAMAQVPNAPAATKPLSRAFKGPAEAAGFSGHGLGGG